MIPTKDERLRALVLMLYRLRCEDHRDHRHCLVGDCVVRQADDLISRESAEQLEPKR